MFRDLGRPLGDAVLEQVGRTASRIQETTSLEADLLESDDSYLIVFDGPGATVDNTQVRYKGRSVLIRIDRFRDPRDGFEMRYPGRGLTLEGEYQLPADALVNPNDATATIRSNGTIMIQLPKRDATEEP